MGESRKGKGGYNGVQIIEIGWELVKFKEGTSRGDRKLENAKRGKFERSE